MTLFDDFGKKLSNVAQTTVQKSKDLAETAKVNIAIAAEEKEIRKAFAEIGRWYYKSHRFDAAAEVAPHVEKITASLAKIEEWKAANTEETLVFHCHSCGEAVSADDRFCPNCGTSVQPLTTVE